MNRREVIAAAAALAAVSATGAQAAAGARVVIVGSGYGGASVARTLRRVAPEVHVTLVEREANLVSCPRSNVVIAGLAQMNEITFGDAGLRKAGIAVVRDEAVEIDAPGRTVRLKSGRRLAYDRLVLSPGVDFVWNTLEGYDAAAAEIMPHAWKAGPQTLLLRDKLRAMPDGGLVLIAAPADPYRCPPGPYERACLVADYLKREKPRSKILILDAKDTFSKQPLFQEAWTTLYPGMVEWIPAAKSGRVRAVKAGEGIVSTDFDDHKAAVANIIPPQRAGRRRVRRGPGGTDRVLQGRSGHLRIRQGEGRAPGGRRDHAGRHAEVGVRRQRPGQGLRPCARRPAARRAAAGADAHQHLLQPGLGDLGIFDRGGLQAAGRGASAGQGQRRDQSGGRRSKRSRSGGPI